MTPTDRPRGNPAEDLTEGLSRLGLALSAHQQQQLLGHLDLIAKWNRVYNLTAVRDPQEMMTHHLLDSLAALPALLRFREPARLAHPESSVDANPWRILDVGSGAGLPGVTWSIALPPSGNHHITCVDAVAKKAGFIRQVGVELGLPKLLSLHGRVEALKIPAVDLITSRAFSSLADLVRLTAHHLRSGGVWMALKGVRPDDEIMALPPHVEVFHVEPITVPFLSAQRCIVWMRLKPA